MKNPSSETVRPARPIAQNASPWRDDLRRRVLALRCAVGLLAIAALPSAGTAQKSAAQKGEAQVLRLLSAMNAAYALCTGRIGNDVMGWQIQQLKSDTAIQRDSLMAKVRVCPDSVEGVIDTLFRAARKQRISTAGASLLKDMYADWTVNLSEMIPTGAETSDRYASMYSRRMEAMYNDFRRKAERLKLELE